MLTVYSFGAKGALKGQAFHNLAFAHNIDQQDPSLTEREPSINELLGSDWWFRTPRLAEVMTDFVVSPHKSCPLRAFSSPKKSLLLRGWCCRGRTSRHPNRTVS